MPFSFTKIDHWCIFPLELEAALPQRKWVFAHNFFPKDYYLGVLRLFLRMCRQQGVSSSGVGGRGWAAAGSAAAGSGETRGPGWRRAGRMCNAIFELRQRRFFSRVIFSSPESLPRRLHPNGSFGQRPEGPHRPKLKDYAKTALQIEIAHPTLPFLCIFWD